MAKGKDINNHETAPKGQAEVKAGVDNENIDDSHLTADDNLKTEIEELEKQLKDQPESPRVKQEVGEETVTEEYSDTEQTDTEEISDDLLKKSPEELAKMYKNLQKKLGEHSNELGELRKFREEQDVLKKETERYQLSAANQHLVNNIIDKMTPDQTNQFLEDLASNPKKALIPVISEVIKPYALTQAKYNNMMAVQELKTNTKDDIVPYEKIEKEVNELLSNRDKNGRNEFWDRYGSGAFEKAYQEVRLRKAPEILKQKEEEIISNAKKEADKYTKKVKAYTEPQGPTSRNVGKSVDYDNMDPEEAIKRLEKILQ